MFRCVLCSENHQTSMMSSLFIICHFLFWAPGGWYGNNNTNIIINNKARAAGPGLELGLYGWERPARARVRRLYRTSLCSWHFFTASVNKAKNRKHLRLQIQRSRWRFNRNGLRHINIWTHFCPERSNTPKHRFDICLLERRRFPLHDEDDDLLKLLQTVKESKHSCLQVKGQPAALWCGHSWYFFITRVLLLHWRVYVLLHHVSCDPRRVWLSSSSAESSHIGSSHSRDHSSSSCVIIWSQTRCADVCQRSELQIWDIVKTDKMKICYQIWIQHQNHHKHLTDSSFMFQHGNDPNTPPAQGSTPGQKHTGELSEPQHHWSFILTANTPASFRKPGELFPRILTELTLSSRLKYSNSVFN